MQRSTDLSQYRILVILSAVLFLYFGMQQSQRQASAQNSLNTVVESFTLINADTDEPIAGFDPISDNASLNLDTLPTLNLNIRANLAGTPPGSVQFGLNERPIYRDDNFAPFTIGGDLNNDYLAWTPSIGEYELTATPYELVDGAGASGVELTIRFEVETSAENLAPSVSIASDIELMLPLNQGILNGTVVDPDGDDDSLTLLWTVQDVPPGADLPTLSGVNTPSLLVEDMVEGDYRFRLNAIDDKGLGNFSDAWIYVRGELDQPPLAEAGDAVELSLPLQAGALYGSGYDDNKIVRYEWKQTNGPSKAIVNGTTTPTLLVSGLTRVGSYVFELTVWDDNGASHSDTATISVNPDPYNNPAEVTVSEDITVTLPIESISLEATAIDNDGAIESIEWYEVRGLDAQINPTNTLTTTITELKPGNYVFRASVYDNSGNLSFDAVRVTVNDVPNDLPSLTVPDDLQLTFPATTVLLVAKAVDTDGTIKSWTWTQVAGPDKATLWGPDSAELEISNLGVGDYTFSVTATDNRGAAVSDEVNITVVNPLQQSVPSIDGKLTKWEPITLTFDGPYASETDKSPNPFLDYRLQVIFTSPSGANYSVPGFFAGDGIGGATGNKWRVRFSADEVGEWTYRASFMAGANLAVDLDMNAGMSTSFDGSNGNFAIADIAPDSSGFFSSGRLDYVGEHYLKSAENGYWIKGGIASPDNLLGYAGFDNTADQGNLGSGLSNGVHRFSLHTKNWREGDPDWTGNNSFGSYDGKAIIGALNYLAEQQVNSISVMPLNLGGKGRETYPFVGFEKDPYTKTHYDIGKLAQWNILFEHAQRMGIQLHIMLGESAEANELWLDEGAMDIERQLFYREMVARFGWAPAIKWNIGETFDRDLPTLFSYASYLDAIDWADHPTAVQTAASALDLNATILGTQELMPLFTASSIQYSVALNGTPENGRPGDLVEALRRGSASIGHNWVIDMDENGPEDVGLTPTNIDQMRKQVLYDVLFSGGNIEWFMNGDAANSELESFKPYELMWQQTAYARNFLEDNTPFWEMVPGDSLLTYSRDDGQVFYKSGDVYTVYLPEGLPESGEASLDLSAETERFSIRWFNPRTGEFEGSTDGTRSGRVVSLGEPPSDPGEDWVVLLKAGEQRTLAAPVSAAAPEGDGYVSILSLFCLGLMYAAHGYVFRPKADSNTNPTDKPQDDL